MFIVIHIWMNMSHAHNPIYLKYVSACECVYFLIWSSAFDIGLKRFPFCEKFNLVPCKQLITVDTSWKLTRGSFLLNNNNIAKILHKNINNSSIDNNNNNNNCNILSLLQSIFKMYLLIEYLGCGVLTWWTQNANWREIYLYSVLLSK